MKKLFALLLALSMLLTVSAAAQTLTGEAEGFGGPVKVTLTMDGDKIVGLVVEGSEETPGIGDNAINELPARILAAGGADVDTVGGATVTSKAILEAVKNALGDTEEAPAEEPAVEETPAEEPAAEEPAEQPAQDGEVLTGTAEGFGGPLTVSVTRKDGKIVSVEVTEHSETDGICDPALEQLPQAIVDAGSADVDTVGGATMTSKAILEAVKNALGDTEDAPAEEPAAEEPAVEETPAEEPAAEEPAVEEPAEQPAQDGEVLTGTAEGFGGPLTVSVTRKDGKIVNVEVTEHNETDGICDPALEQLPQAIVDAGSADVDTVGGATMTSKAILEAVKNALGDTEEVPAEEPAAEEPAVETPAEEPAAETTEEAAEETYFGFGMDSIGRIGPGKDDQDVQVYSVNEVYAGALFDKDGKILHVYVDQLEFATPNYDGEGMPHFTGYPGHSYNYDENHDGKVDSVLEATEETFQQEIAGWMTKRARGDSYRMNTGTWTNQMDAFQQLFVGKTVDEIEEWFNLYTAKNGRPLKPEQKNEEDAQKYQALSDEEKAMLADVTSTATMSLNDSHGNILAALRKAYDNRQPLTVSAQDYGFGVNFSGRIGPGKDDQDVQVYSINQVFATTLFDAEGRITHLFVDQLETATPNYDGEGMPHFTGYPGFSYNYDENHDGKVDSVLEATEETFQQEIAGWMTKRERGDSYRMNTGTWTNQMDAFQQLFVGKTVDEVEEWFNLYTAKNGRPLKPEQKNEEDAQKYQALSDEEKAMLADVTSTATMSLNDSHGNILAAIRASFEGRMPLELTAGK